MRVSASALNTLRLLRAYNDSTWHFSFFFQNVQTFFRGIRTSVRAASLRWENKKKKRKQNSELISGNDKFIVLSTAYDFRKKRHGLSAASRHRDCREDQTGKATREMEREKDEKRRQEGFAAIAFFECSTPAIMDSFSQFLCSLGKPLRRNRAMTTSFQHRVHRLFDGIDAEFR